MKLKSYKVNIQNLKVGDLMGFKSIEMQIAIPRSQDAGKMQDQMMKQGQQFQDTLTEQQIREELLKRKQVKEYDKVEKQTVKDEEKNKQNFFDIKEKEKEEMKEFTVLNHPFLGKNVDFSG